MNIAVINTGGTISCVGNPLNPMKAKQFAGACQNLLDNIFISGIPGLTINYITDLAFPESVQYGTLDSTNLQPTDWCLIANYILENYDKYDGWVVLHGTDSLDFTGTALPFLLSAFDEKGNATACLSKPIIITGSQVPLFYQATSNDPLTLNFNTDAYQNVCGALAAAQTGIPEVCVYFQNKLYRGNRVVKTNASEFNAFSSPNFPILGEYGVGLTIDPHQVGPGPVDYQVSLDNPVVRNNVLLQLNYITAHINNFPVMQLNAVPAQYTMGDQPDGFLAQLIRSLPALNLKALVLESYGEGNFPSGNPDKAVDGSIYQALDAVNKQGIVIIDCTQVISGVINDSAYLAGAWLPGVGALSPADMTPMAAFAKIMILMSAAEYNGWSLDTVKTLFQTNLLGEMLSVNKLDSRSNAALLPGQSLYALDGSARLANDQVAGPVLRDKQNKVLWAALTTPPSADQMPGRLVMHNNGNLVFYSRFNTVLWASNTSNPEGANTLSIAGSSSNQSLLVSVYDYADKTQRVVLYPN